jgi:Putative Actinobacterial Holin-X, holin superfamily III
MMVSTNDFPMQRVGTDAPARTADLVRQLSDDSRRLAGNEIRLAKLEMASNLQIGGRGAMAFGVAFGAGVVALSALTIGLVAALTLAIGKVWVAALVTGAAEVLIGYLAVRQGRRAFSGFTRGVPQAGHEIVTGVRQITTGRAD